MQLNPAVLSDARILAAYTIFFASYFVFALGKFPGMKIDRPGAAIIGAVLMVAFRIMSAQEALRAIDFATIVLLFSMMLIVANLHLGGFFEWVTEAVFVRLSAPQLLAALMFTSGILSAFLVNDVVCLVMTPFVVKLTRRLGLKPIPYLLAVATASNIGSVATITGNPQNMLIGSVSRISYLNFLAHLGPIAIVGLLTDWALILLKSLVPGFPDTHIGWLTLAMSSTLAGNLTITGSVANIIVVERARPDVHIGFRDYFRLGLPLTLVTMLFGIAWLTWVH